MPNLETRMDDVRAVMDAVGSERAVLLGYSEGGPMCALFAATYPERTSALHTGECEVIGDKLGGIAVHIGARVAALAEPNEVLVSSTVRDLVAGSGLSFQDRDVHTLRGVPGEWRLFAVERAHG